MLIGEHSSDFLNYLSYLSHCDRGKESFEIHAWMLKTLLSEADPDPFIHYIIAASFRKMIRRMQNSNSKTYYDCLQNQESSSLTFKAPSEKQKKSRDKPLIIIIISLAKAKDFIKIPNLQHAALKASKSTMKIPMLSFTSSYANCSIGSIIHWEDFTTSRANRRQSKES